jgi:hypothetical protein
MVASKAQTYPTAHPCKDVDIKCHAYKSFEDIQFMEAMEDNKTIQQVTTPKRLDLIA